MNIKQAEAKTGITKQNIRFYEAQGLLHPAREAQNSYRDYTQSDIDTLKRIKILRKLGVPVPVVGQVLAGDTALSDALRAQREALEQQRAELDGALRLCRTLEHESMDTLDADACLAQMEQQEQEGNVFMKIFDDFKQVSRQEGAQFSFTPDTMIGNAREFTDELLLYAKTHGRDIVITKESMYPEFTLDGAAYSATRFHSRLGASVRCTPLALEEQRAQDTPLRKALRVFYRALPLCFLFVFMWVTFNEMPFWLRLLLAAGLTLAALGSWYVLYDNRD